MYIKKWARQTPQSRCSGADDKGYCYFGVRFSVEIETKCIFLSLKSCPISLHIQYTLYKKGKDLLMCYLLLHQSWLWKVCSGCSSCSGCPVARGSPRRRTGCGPPGCSPLQSSFSVGQAHQSAWTGTVRRRSRQWSRRSVFCCCWAARRVPRRAGGPAVTGLACSVLVSRWSLSQRDRCLVALSPWGWTCTGCRTPCLIWGRICRTWCWRSSVLRWKWVWTPWTPACWTRQSFDKVRGWTWGRLAGRAAAGRWARRGISGSLAGRRCVPRVPARRPSPAPPPSWGSRRGAGTRPPDQHVLGYAPAHVHGLNRLHRWTVPSPKHVQVNNCYFIFRQF